MRVRTYGLALLALAGIAPLAIYGALAIQRSQKTSIEQVRQRNQHLAMAAAGSIRDHVTYQQRVLATMGVTVLQAADAELAYDAFELDPYYENFCEIVVYKVAAGELEVVAGAPPPGHENIFSELAREVAQDGSAPLRVARRGGDPRFGHILSIAEPIVIAGRVEGVVVAGYDLVGVWMTIDAIRIESTGFIRLISSGGDTIAHGQPDERRAVFMDDDDDNLRLLAAATEGSVTSNRQGQEIVVSAAVVPSLRWRDSGYSWSILVEQSVDEAFADAQAMRRALIIVGLGVLLFVVAIALLIGRGLVHGLETLREHTSKLPTNLDRRLEFRSALKELTDLANTIDGMAVDLVRERDEARKRERLTTFAGVAAGLAHDLRTPIENVREACETVNRTPDDDRARDSLRKVSQGDLPRLKRFVDDLQRLARQGHLELALESITPEAIIQDVGAEVASTRKWAGVEVDIRGHAAAIPGDPYLIRRAVFNLASNAADACIVRGPGHRVALEVADVDGAVEIRVIDTGEGIAPEELARLQGGDFHSTKRSTGLGLGLFVVWKVALSHQGTLTIESERGKGSTFTLRLPRVLGEPAQ